MNIIFAGTPEFAVPSLTALLDAGHQIISVYTQPDRPAGRGQKLHASAVKQWALQHNIEIRQPTSLRDQASLQQLLSYHDVDVIVVAAYGLLLPQSVLDFPRYGCLNIHASWLPRWRGASPIQQAVLAGDTETGISIMKMDAGLDTGDVFCLQGLAITSDETAQSLQTKLAELGAQAIVETLQQIEQGTAVHTPQQESLATHAPKLTKAQAKLDWQLDALELERCVRAYNPWPVAWATLDDETVKIWQAKAIAKITDNSPGTIIEPSNDYIDIACGEGILRITELQFPNKPRQTVLDIINGHQHDLQIGRRFV